MSKECRQFSVENKREALKFVKKPQLTVAEATRHLGNSPNVRDRWKSQLATEGDLSVSCFINHVFVHVSSLRNLNS